jgi:hypothetical protein
MVAHSARWNAQGAETVFGDAEEIPFADERFDVVVASLGDPYNTLAFWKNVRSVVSRRGLAIFTTPSFEWADEFRSQNQEPVDCAEFLLRDGSRVLVRSLILPERDQISLMKRCGLSVIGVYHVLLAALRGEPLSQKLDMNPDLPFVTGYLARRAN